MSTNKKIERTSLLKWFWMILFLAVLVACNQEGVGGFSANSSRATLITDDGKLHTVNLDGSNLRVFTSTLDINFGTSLSPSGDRVVYMQDSNIITNSADGGSPTVLFQASNNPGVLTFVPSGEVLYYARQNDQSSLFIIDPLSGSLNLSETGLDQVFGNQSFFKARLGSGGAEFIMRPYRSREVAIVAISGQETILYTINAAGLSNPMPLRRRFTRDLHAHLADRDHVNITSAVLSDDGRKLIFRAKLSDPTRYSLYAIDLESNTDYLPPLVSEWSSYPEYSISPDSRQVVFECPDEGRSVCIYDFTTKQRSVLVPGASQPLWVENPPSGG